jgi:hypothetical protein
LDLLSVRLPRGEGFRVLNQDGLPDEGGNLSMQPAAVWIVYTLMFGYPVPMRDAREFTNQTACEIYNGSLDVQVVGAFQLVCARK